MAEYDREDVIDVPGVEVPDDGGPAPDPGPVERHWRCERCARGVPTYVGRCPGCRLINTLRLVDGPCPPPFKKKPRQPQQDPYAAMRLPTSGGYEEERRGSRPIGEVEDDFEPCERILTGVAALDHVLGPADPGAARGSVVLIGGDPGTGKTTVLLQALAGVAERGETALFVSSEQTETEVYQYADRLGILSNATRRCMRVVYTSSLEDVEAEVAEHAPAMLVLDSLNDFTSIASDGKQGGIQQAVAVMKGAYRIATGNQITVFVVSQVTKDGDFASSKAVQHECHVVARMRLVDDPQERWPIEQVAGSHGPDGKLLDFVELICPGKNRFGKRRVPGYFVVGESGFLQSVDVQVPAFPARRGRVTLSVVEDDDRSDGSGDERPF